MVDWKPLEIDTSLIGAEPSISDAMVQAGAKEVDPYCFTKDEDGKYLGDELGRQDARSFARRIIIAALRAQT